MFRSASVMAFVCVLSLTQAEAQQATTRQPPAQQAAPATYPQKVRTFHTADEARRLAPGLRLHRTVDPAIEMTLRRAVTGFPIAQFTVIAPESNSVTWVGTPQ